VCACMCVCMCVHVCVYVRACVCLPMVEEVCELASEFIELWNTIAHLEKPLNSTRQPLAKVSLVLHNKFSVHW